MEDLSRIRTLAAQGQRAEALRALNSYLARNPRQEEAWLLTETLLQSLEEKQRLLKKGLEFLPNSTKLKAQLRELELEGLEDLSFPAGQAILAPDEEQPDARSESQVLPVRIVDVKIPFWALTDQLVVFYFASLVAGIVVLVIGFFLGLLLAMAIFLFGMLQ